MNKAVTLILSLALFVNAFASNLPTGSTSPEGVACDMATAFINADSGLWKKVVLKLKKPEYEQFIEDVSQQMDWQATLPAKERIGPKIVGIVFAMSPLSKNGPNSYAYAAMNLEEIGYVDVVVQNHDGSKEMNRTFVARKDDVWYALPRPDLFPLLTAGLNQEPVSKSVVYQIK